MKTASSPSPTTLTPAQRDNLVCWTPDRSAGMYESHFLKLNILDEHIAFWCRFTILQRESGPCDFEVWAVLMDAHKPEQSIAIKQRIPHQSVGIERSHFELRYGQNTLTHGHSAGSLNNGQNRLAWNLDWAVSDHGFRHFPHESMYSGEVPKTKLLSPTPSSDFHGWIEVDGKRVSFSRAPGMQGHNWGREHAETWIWAHCNAFDRPGVMFEGATSHLSLGPLRSPPLTILHLTLPSEAPITVNSWSAMLTSRSRRHGLTWRFRGDDGNRALEGWFNAPVQRFVGLHYEDPSTLITNCLNSTLADGQVRLLHKSGGVWRLKDLFAANATAALEIGLKGETEGVRLYV